MPIEKKALELAKYTICKSMSSNPTGLSADEALTVSAEFIRLIDRVVQDD